MTDFNPLQLARMDTARLSAYRQNLDFYNGSQWTQTSRHRQLVFNYAKVAIDKVTSYLMPGLNFACYAKSASSSLRGAQPSPSLRGAQPSLSLRGAQPSLSLRGAQRRSNLEPEQARVRRAEQLLREVYEQNNLQQLDWETEIDAAVLGDGCYKVIWDAEEKRIRVTAPDVSGLFAWWLGDDLAKVWRVASQYKLTQDELRLLYGPEIATPSARNDRKGAAANAAPPVIARSVSDKAISLNTPTSRLDDHNRSGGVHPRLESYGQAIPKKQATITELWTSKTFDLFLDNELIESKPNPYGFIPFVIFPNLREPKKFWGTSDIPNMIQPQRELNRALSQLSRILELSGNPIAVLENVGTAEDIKVQPGAVWTIPEDAKAYLLDLLQGGGIRLHIDFIDLIYRCLHDISETPRAAYGGVERDLSGAALNIELGSLVQKVTRKRTIRTNAYHHRNEMILSLAEKYMGENFDGITHRVVWGPILPQDVARQAQNEQLLVQAGVHSRRTAMDELGIQDPDEEFGRWLEERTRILQMERIDTGSPR